VITEEQRLAGIVEYQRLAAETFAAYLPGRDPSGAIAVWRLCRAASLAERALEAAVHRPRGRSWAAFRVLYTLRTLGSTEPGTLAELLDIAPPSVSSLLSTLERSDLISRRPDPSNRRRVIVELTEAGREAADETILAQTDAQDSFISSLSPEEAATLSSILEKLLNSIWMDQRKDFTASHGIELPTK
jgi:MarR family transcriptional regulator, negative regulator of the multidrug operon emrRAB